MEHSKDSGSQTEKPQQASARPHGRSLSDFGTLKSAEKTLLDSCRLGETAEIGSSRPTQPHADNTIRAGFLRFLLLGGDNQTPVHEHGIQLCGAIIEDTLSLSAASVWHDVSFSLCTFAHTPVLTDAKLMHSIKFVDCELPGLEGQRLIVGGMLSMRKVSSQGRILLLDAQIGGQFNCSGASFDGKSDDALSLDGAAIGGDAFLHNGFKAQGPVRLMGTKIGGQLNCRGASFDGKSGTALSIEGAVVKGDVFLSRDFKAKRAVKLTGIQIDGQLNCGGANFDGEGKEALAFDGAVIRGDVFLHNGFKSKGTVRFLEAQIDGQFNCANASFSCENGNALTFDGTVIKGSVFLDEGFNAEGSVRFTRAQINGQLNCIGANFNGSNGEALAFDGAMIKGDVLLHSGFKAVGEVRLLNSQIFGSLDCSGSSFDGNNDDALALDGALIKGNVLLNDGFKSEGTVRLLGAQINGQLDCSYARFDGKQKSALFAKRLRVLGALELRNLILPLHKASFVGARVAVLNDDEIAWGEDIEINGFVYDFIDANAPLRAATRLLWLDKQTKSEAGSDGLLGTESNFCPQPWRQLQHVLKEMGHAEEAFEVGLAFEYRLRKAGLIGQSPANWPKYGRWLYSRLSRGLHFTYGMLTGFGYRPMRLLGWFLATWLTCAGFYWWAAEQENVFAPSNPIVFQHADYLKCRPDRESAWRNQNPPLVRAVPIEFTGPGNWYLCKDLREEYAALSPLAFSLDVLLPLVDLQQEKGWAPMIPTPKTGFEEITAFGWKHFTRWILWTQTLFGWLFSLLLVALVSGLARRKE